MVTSARAIETRIFMPPESCARKMPVEFGQARHARSHLRRAARLWRSATPASSSGSRTLASTRAQGIKVGSWNTKASAARPARPAEVAAPPQQAAVGRFDQVGDQLEQRALAAAGRADQRQKFAVRDREIDRRQPARAVAENFFGRKHFHRRRPLADRPACGRCFRRTARRATARSCPPSIALILRSLTKRSSKALLPIGLRLEQARLRPGSRRSSYSDPTVMMPMPELGRVAADRSP